jgi:hypothetical protein
VAGRSLVQQCWSDYDDAALLEIAAETLADLRSGDAKRQHGAREQLEELQTELRRRGVWATTRTAQRERLPSRAPAARYGGSCSGADSNDQSPHTRSRHQTPAAGAIG